MGGSQGEWMPFRPGSEACGSVFCRQWPENIVPDGELVGAKFGRLPEKSLSLPIRGEVLEWLKRRAWKARIRLKRIRGSNPLLSATNAENQQIAKQTPSFAPKNVKSGVFVLFKIIQPLHNKRVAILKESDEKRLIFIYPFTLIFQDFTSS